MRRFRLTRARAASLAVAVVVAGALAWMHPGLRGTAAGKDDSEDQTSPTLAAQLAEARAATLKYVSNLDRAKADGYQIITQMIPNMGFHYLNPGIQGFDIHRPPILVFEHRGNTWQLGALEWVFPTMPAAPPLPNATFGFFPAACHYVDGTFVTADAQSKCPSESPESDAAFNFWHPPLFTLHVWVWYPNPDGLYASTNPLLTPYNVG